MNEVVPTRPGTRRRSGFAARLLVAQALVLLATSLTAWLVASAIGPGIFDDHLDRAGVDHTAAEVDHVEEAFASALLVALMAALTIAIVLALAVTWYFSRRVQRWISRVGASVSAVAAGDYGSRIPSPGVGEEFDQLTQTFNALAERLEAVESTRRRMLADLAHEMRTPLATIDAHLEALEDGVRSLDPATLTVLRSSTDRLGRLARDIAAVSKAQEGNLELTLGPTSSRRLVDVACQAARERYAEKGVALDQDVPTDAVVVADPARIGQALGNLLDNALRHTPPGGSVTVSSRPAGGWVEITVSDTGEGIEPEHLGQVFDRFFRADASRSSDRGGSGIGLTITKALVEAQGGQVSAHSAGAGRGARFVVRLPRASA